MSHSPQRVNSPGRQSPSPRHDGSPNKTFLTTGFDDIKSSCGEQVDSRKRTAPTTCFGTSSRPKDGDGSKSPGPGTYQVPSAIGKPVISTIKAAPACSISGREKFGSTADLKSAANCPGPGDYTPHIVNPNEKNAPQFSLGKKWNKSLEGVQKVPGPGAYDTPENLLNTKTVLSTSKSATASSFSKDNRKPLTDSSLDVGPGQYATGNVAVGKQIVSTVPNSAAFSFSVVGRTRAPIGARMAHDRGPAPNAYKQTESVGTQVLSTYKTAPKCTMSGRTKFGSHF